MVMVDTALLLWFDLTALRVVGGWERLSSASEVPKEMYHFRDVWRGG